MTDDTVPSDEMRPIRSHIDPIDAVLGEDPLDEDLADVAAIVHDVRSAYLPQRPLERDPRLAAFTGTHLDHDGDLLVTAASPARGQVPPAPGRSHRRDRIGRKHDMLSALSGFVASLAGKVVLGTAVTAASVGGLHAADVVDVPVLPDNDAPAAEEQAAEAGAEGQQTGEAKQAAAEAYTDAHKAWAECVATNAAAQGDETTRVTGEDFDPKDGCGDPPHPSDFGLTDLPDQASDAAQDAIAGTPAGDGTAAGGAGATAATERGKAPATPPAPGDAGNTGGGDGAPAAPPTTNLPVDPESGDTSGLFGLDGGPTGGRP
ncbi:MAG TPA: hypothetical protein VFZ68_15225 [Acidimicrobiales bacterium]